MVTVKEVLPIVIGVALWEGRWHGRTIRCWCDNAAVVAILRSGPSKDVKAMHLMRSLFFLATPSIATICSLICVHVPNPLIQW